MILSIMSSILSMWSDVMFLFVRQTTQAITIKRIVRVGNHPLKGWFLSFSLTVGLSSRSPYWLLVESFGQITNVTTLTWGCGGSRFS